MLKEVLQHPFVSIPDPGGTYKADFNLNETIVLARPIERISPLKEASKPTFKEDLADLDLLHQKWNFALKIRSGKEILNYDPVVERWKYEQLSLEQREQFKNHELAQLKSVLKERFHVAQSEAVYSIDSDLKLRNEKLPDEAFEVSLQRGIGYFKSLNSPDVPRMEKEREGFLKVQEKLADKNTPIGTKLTIISPPGLAKGTIFTYNFVDTYETVLDSKTGKKVVKMTRVASDLTYEEYKEKVISIKPDYFNEIKDPLDEHFLSHPLEREIFAKDEKAMKEEDFQKIAEGNKERTKYLIEAICESVFNPEKVAETLNAFLNGADLIWEKITNKVSGLANFFKMTFRNLQEEIKWLGHQAVRIVAAACGFSAGVSFGSFLSSLTGISLSGIFGSSEVKSGFCEKCGGGTGDDHYHCHKCPKKYASERKKRPEERTKECSCGAKFGC